MEKWIICEQDCQTCPFAAQLQCPPGDRPQCKWCSWAPVCPCTNPKRSPERAAKILAEMGKKVEALVFLPPEIIQPPPFPMREKMDHEKLQELAQSMASDLGMVEPLVVRPAKGGGVQLVVGSRRLAAAKIGSMSAVQCRIKELSDRDALLLGLMENLQREDLTWAEEARGLAKLQLITHWSGRRIAKEIGKSYRWVNDRLQAQATLVGAGIEPTRHKMTRSVSPEQTVLPVKPQPTRIPPLQAVTAVAKVPEVKKRRKILTEAIEKGLTQEETRARVAEVLGKKPAPATRRPAAPPKLERLVEEGMVTKGMGKIPFTRKEVLYLCEVVIKLNVGDFLHRRGMECTFLAHEPGTGKSLTEKAMESIEDFPLEKLKEVLLEEAGRVLKKFEPAYLLPYFNLATQARVDKMEEE